MTDPDDTDDTERHRMAPPRRHHQDPGPEMRREPHAAGRRLTSVNRRRLIVIVLAALTGLILLQRPAAGLRVVDADGDGADVVADRGPIEVPTTTTTIAPDTTVAEFDPGEVIDEEPATEPVDAEPDPPSGEEPLPIEEPRPIEEPSTEEPASELVSVVPVVPVEASGAIDAPLAAGDGGGVPWLTVAVVAGVVIALVGIGGFVPVER